MKKQEFLKKLKELDKARIAVFNHYTKQLSEIWEAENKLKKEFENA